MLCPPADRGLHFTREPGTGTINIKHTPSPRRNMGYPGWGPRCKRNVRRRQVGLSDVLSRSFCRAVRFCPRSRAGLTPSLPPSTSIATSGRSSRRTASIATGRTRTSARPSCGSTSGTRRSKPARSSRRTPLASELVARINSTDPKELMPPPKSNRRLTPEQKKRLERWIEEGANYATHWAFVAPERPAEPAVKGTSGCGTRSTGSCSRSSKPEGCHPRPRPTGPPSSSGSRST